MNKKMWWGYLHINGTLQIKRYFGIQDIEEAQDSPFCKEVYGPFEAISHDDAARILKQEAAEDLKEIKHG